jgi:hypothetical protein
VHIVHENSEQHLQSTFNNFGVYCVGVLFGTESNVVCVDHVRSHARPSVSYSVVCMKFVVGVLYRRLQTMNTVQLCHTWNE